MVFVAFPLSLWVCECMDRSCGSVNVWIDHNFFLHICGFVAGMQYSMFVK